MTSNETSNESRSDPSYALDAYERAGFGGGATRGRRPALVVVDFQRGFTEAAFGTGADMADAVAAANELIDVFHQHGEPVYFTVIAYDPAEIDAGIYPWLEKFRGGATLVTGTPPVDIDPRAHMADGDILLAKKGASAFFGTPLAHALHARGIDTLIVTGATTSGCLRASVVDAVQSGFPTIVPREAVADRAQAPHEASLFDIDQKYADVVSLDQALAYARSALESKGQT